MTEFALAVLKAQRGLAVKRRTRSTQGKTIKSDPTLNEALWQIRRHSIEADVDKITLFHRAMAKRQDLCVVHGDPAPGLDPHSWHRRLRMRAFVLPGRRQTADVAWNEFAAVLKTYERHERQAHAEGATGGWRSVMTHRLGNGEGKLGFFKTTSIALGYAARSGEPANEVAAEMRAIIAAHPDLTADRDGQYTVTWLVRELLRLRAKDAARRVNAEHALINRAKLLLNRD